MVPSPSLTSPSGAVFSGVPSLLVVEPPGWSMRYVFGF